MDIPVEARSLQHLEERGDAWAAEGGPDKDVRRLIGGPPAQVATVTRLSPVRSIPGRRILRIVTPRLVAAPGPAGSSNKPPPRATILSAGDVTVGMAAPGLRGSGPWSRGTCRRKG
jgi:hypothetical protein